MAVKTILYMKRTTMTMKRRNNNNKKKKKKKKKVFREFKGQFGFIN